MKTFGLVGKSLSHSFSQQYFTNKFKIDNILDAEYKLFSLSKIDEVKELLKHPNLQGFNVTIPYKTEIIPYLDKLDSVAQEVGAVNCVVKENGKWIGYNTDVVGFDRTLEEAESLMFKSSKVQKFKSLIIQNTKRSLSNFEGVDGKSGRGSLYFALILGSGGASKAVCYVLNQRKIPYQIVSRNKTPQTITYDEITQLIINHYPLIINTTPLGMFPHIEEKPPLPYSAINSNHVFIDLIYNPEETLFLKEGKKQGATTINGAMMFYAQAEESYLRFKKLKEL